MNDKAKPAPAAQPAAPEKPADEKPADAQLAAIHAEVKRQTEIHTRFDASVFRRKQTGAPKPAAPPESP